MSLGWNKWVAQNGKFIDDTNPIPNVSEWIHPHSTYVGWGGKPEDLFGPVRNELCYADFNPIFNFKEVNPV